MTFIDLCESLHLKLGTTWRKKLQNYHDHSFTGACMNITRIRWKTKMFAVVFYCLCGISWKKLGVRFDYSLHFSPLIKKGLFSKQFLFLKVFLRLIHASWVNNEGGFMWYTDIIKLLNGRCSDTVPGSKVKMTSDFRQRGWKSGCPLHVQNEKGNV